MLGPGSACTKSQVGGSEGGWGWRETGGSASQVQRDEKKLVEGAALGWCEPLSGDRPFLEMHLVQRGQL